MIESGAGNSNSFHLAGIIPIAGQAANTAADLALIQNPTKFTIMWGAKRYPNAAASARIVRAAHRERLAANGLRLGHICEPSARRGGIGAASW